MKKVLRITRIVKARGAIMKGLFLLFQHAWSMVCAPFGSLRHTHNHLGQALGMKLSLHLIGQMA
jgi:hypothetical protein